MTTEEVKALFKRGRTIDREIKIINDEYEQAAASAENIAASTEYVMNLEKRRHDLYQTKNEIFKMIDLLEDGNLRIVMELRYIKRMEWQQIVNEMHYSWTSVFRFHEDAIKNIAEKI